MAKKRVCDICGEEVNQEQPKIISIRQYIEDENIEKDNNPSREFDACDQCMELSVYSWDNQENIKAMFLSIKQRRARLGKPRKSEKTSEN